jgi:hypothetical protein
MRVLETHEIFRTQRVKYKPTEILANRYKIRHIRSVSHEDKSFRIMELAEGFEPPTL